MSAQEYDGMHAMQMYFDCFGMLAEYYAAHQQAYPGVRYISPYATPRAITQFPPFRELNLYVSQHGYNPYTPEKMAQEFREFPMSRKSSEPRNHFMRSKM
jgi:hypothetical protein